MIRVILSEPWAYENRLLVLDADGWFYKNDPARVTFYKASEDNDPTNDRIVAVLMMDRIIGFEVLEEK